jgi:chorismate synthase
MPLRFLTAGESHGPSLTAILEGMPAGLRLDRAALDRAMARRQKGFGSGGRMSIERDRVEISAGVQAGRTTGAPIAIHIANRDYSNWRDREIEPMTIPRPGHADLSASVKYGYGDLRLALERASARETAARVAVGAICAQLLEAAGIRIGSYVAVLGAVEAPLSALSESADYLERFEAAEADELRCPDPQAAAAMRRAVQEAARARDTLGGIFEVVALGCPPGLGSHVHWDRRLSARLIGALASIQAIKGVELGPAFENARLRGTEVHDRLSLAGRRIRRLGARGGGIEGGISTGEPILLRAAMKPISTTLTPLASVDLASGEPAETRYERSDICALPRAAVVGEAMLAFVLADALLEKLGGDSMDEILPRLAGLRRADLDDLPMDGQPWRFDYEADLAEDPGSGEDDA